MSHFHNYLRSLLTVVSFGMRWTRQGKSCLKHLEKDCESVFGLWQTPERK